MQTVHRDIGLRVLEVESFDQAGQVRGCSTQHQHMEYLVRASPDVKAARPNAFGKSDLGASSRHGIGDTSIGENLTAYMAAPAMYMSPCATSQSRAILSLKAWSPYNLRPLTTGKMAERPSPTNMAARTGRKAGVRNLSRTAAMAQAMLLVVIWAVSARLFWAMCETDHDPIEAHVGRMF